ncbi:MAG TPA: acyl-CoA dehydrogenase family protein [bacterium]
MKFEIEETVRRFAAKDLLPVIQQLDEYKPDIKLKEKVVSGIKNIGIINMPLPESLGGIEFDPAILGRVLEIIAETCAGTSFLLWAHYAALLPFILSKKYDPLKKIGDGQNLTGTGYVSEHSLKITKRGDAFEVSGTINFLWGMPGASFFVIAAKTSENGIFALIPSNAPGINVKEEHSKIGLRGCQSSSVVLNGVAVKSQDAAVMPIAEYEKVFNLSKGYALCLVGAIAAGNARGSIIRAVKYARERYQGCDIIINHTLIQGMVGDMLARAKAAGALVGDALQNFQEGGTNNLYLAKANATREGEKVCLDSMQVFGGYGYMREYGVEKHLRDSKMLCTIGESNMRILQRIVRENKDKEGWI